MSGVIVSPIGGAEGIRLQLTDKLMRQLRRQPIGLWAVRWEAPFAFSLVSRPSSRFCSFEMLPSYDVGRAVSVDTLEAETPLASDMVLRRLARVRNCARPLVTVARAFVEDGVIIYRDDNTQVDDTRYAAAVVYVEVPAPMAKKRRRRRR